MKVKVIILSILYLLFATSAIFSQELPIVVLIASYNNEKWCGNNLSSVFNQKYENYRVIYTDDASTDNTVNLVKNIVASYKQEHRFTLVENKINKGSPLANHYSMVHVCSDQEVVIALDGDDWLADQYVLQKINKAYSNSDKEVWLTYGQFKLASNGTVGWCTPMPKEIIEKNWFRKFEHIPSHLKSFKAALFKAIKREDLFYKDDFFAMTGDMAMMLPMIEMAAERHYCFNEPLYVYNDMNPISEHFKSKSFQREMDLIIRSKKPYLRLAKLPFRKIEKLYPNNTDQIIALAKKYLPSNPIIIEAGAYDGLDSLKLSNSWPQASIYIFEPIPELFGSILNNVKHHQNIIPFDCALGENNGETSFYISSFKESPTVASHSSSLLAPKEHITYAPHVVFNKEIKVPVTTLDTWAERNNISHADFLWLDLQGSELPVMKKSPKIMKTVKVLLVEVEMVEAYKNQALAGEVKQWLEGEGFALIAKDFDETKDWCGNYLFVRE